MVAFPRPPPTYSAGQGLRLFPPGIGWILAFTNRASSLEWMMVHRADGRLTRIRPWLIQRTSVVRAMPRRLQASAGRRYSPMMRDYVAGQIMLQLILHQLLVPHNSTQPHTLGLSRRLFD
jgi:hypothetical protein